MVAMDLLYSAGRDQWQYSIGDQSCSGGWKATTPHGVILNNNVDSLTQALGDQLGGI